MTTQPTPSPNVARLERTYDAPAELIWELFTTAAASATAASMTRRDNSADIVGRMGKLSARVPNVINLQC